MAEVKDLKTTGVYKIQNLIDMKMYIGSASSSRGFAIRFWEHKHDLKRNLHHCPHLQNAWNKYGKDNFIFVPLKTCKPEECLDWEQFFFDTYKPEYNIRKSANNCFGIEWTPEMRENVGKGFCLISPDGKIHTGSNISLFAEKQGVDAKGLINIANGHYKSHKGWTTCFKDYLKLKYYGLVIPDTQLAKPVTLIHKYLGIKKVWNKKEFSREYGISDRGLNNLIKQKFHCRSLNGWHLYSKELEKKFEEEKKLFPVTLVNNILNKEVTFDRVEEIKEFKETYKIDRVSKVVGLLKGKSKSVKNWRVKI